MYEVLIENHAEKDLKSLPKEIFRKLVKSILSLKNNPRPQNCRKMVGSKSDWRIRIGSYRIMYEIDDNAKVVRIFRVKHRKEAYL